MCKPVPESAEKAAPSTARRWLICVLIVLLCVLLFLLVYRTVHSSAKPDTLLSYLRSLDIPAEPVEAPVFSSGYGAPAASSEELFALLQDKTLVEGTVSSVDAVRVPVSDGVWYLAVVTVEVDQTLSGEARTGSLRLIGAAELSGEDISADTVPIPGFSGCEAGMHAVFALRSLPDSSWSISGKRVVPAELADAMPLCILTHDGDNLAALEAGVSVSLSALASVEGAK